MENNYKMLKLALDLARIKHFGQVDMSGDEYVFHPILVALQCNSTESKIVALMHDVLEDTDMTVKDLEDLGFRQDLIKSVELLTHREGSYEEYIKKIKKSKDKIAIEVKLADLTMNLDINRLNGKKPPKYELYLWAFDYLKEN